MDDHDDLATRLTRAMHAGVDASEAGAPTVPNPDDVHRRRARRSRRRVAAGASAAALLVVGAVAAGWAIGRDADRDEQVVSGPSTAADDPGTGIVLGSGDLPTVFPSLGSPGIGGMPGTAGDGPDLPTGHLFTRTLDDGGELEVRGNTYDPSVFDRPPFWVAPGRCAPVGGLSIGARFPTSVGRLDAERWVALAGDDIRGSVGVVGIPEGDPRWLAAVSVAPDVTSVSITFPNGGDDQVAPVDGVAVLSAPVTPGTFSGDPYAEPLDADGELAITILRPGDEQGVPWTTTWPAYDLGNVDGQDQECHAPAVLPAPGAEQPADPAAAEAAIRQSWDVMYGDPTNRTLEDQATVVDDPRDLSEGLESIRARYDEQQIATTTVEIDEVVFASADRAYVRYTVDAGGLGSFGNRFGELRLVDGTWRLTRYTVCALLGLGGFRCPPVDG